MKDRIDTFGAELFAIGIKLARIFVIVLVRPELHGIDKDRGDNGVAGSKRRRTKSAHAKRSCRKSSSSKDRAYKLNACHSAC